MEVQSIKILTGILIENIDSKGNSREINIEKCNI